MQLEIISPDKDLYNGEVSAVIFPGSDGSFGILEDHAPIIATLKSGEIKVTQSDQSTSSFDIKGGTVEVSNNHIIVLAE